MAGNTPRSFCIIRTSLHGERVSVCAVVDTGCFPPGGFLLTVKGNCLARPLGRLAGGRRVAGEARPALAKRGSCPQKRGNSLPKPWSLDNSWAQGSRAQSVATDASSR